MAETGRGPEKPTGNWKEPIVEPVTVWTGSLRGRPHRSIAGLLRQRSVPHSTDSARLCSSARNHDLAGKTDPLCGIGLASLLIVSPVLCNY